VRLSNKERYAVWVEAKGVLYMKRHIAQKKEFEWAEKGRKGGGWSGFEKIWGGGVSHWGNKN